MVFDQDQGFFIHIPATNPVSVTFVGEVPQGNLSNPLVVGAYSIKSSQVPQALPLGRPNSAVGVQTLGFPANIGDFVYLFSNTTGYSSFQFRQIGPNQIWTGANADGPTIPVGAGFFLFKAAGSPNSWNRTFSVN
jgi:hypothetical protein